MMETALDRPPVNPILPPEILDGVGAMLRPEKRLMFAVLREALGVFLKYAAAEHGRGRRLFLEAEHWFAANDTTWPCSFVNVCETLGLDPACVRKRLARCQAAQSHCPNRSPRGVVAADGSR